MAMAEGKQVFKEMDAIRSINQIVVKTDFPVPSTALARLGIDRKTLRNMVHEGVLVQMKVRQENSRTQANGYYVEGGAVPSAFRKLSHAVDAKDAEGNYTSKRTYPPGKEGVIPLHEMSDAAISVALKTMRDNVTSFIKADGNNPDDYHIYPEANLDTSTLSVSAKHLSKKKDGVVDVAQRAGLADHQPASKKGHVLKSRVPGFSTREVNYPFAGESRP